MFATTPRPCIAPEQSSGDVLSKKDSRSLPKGDTSDLPNMRHAQRGPQGRLHVPIVNPAGTWHQSPPYNGRRHSIRGG